MAYHRFHVFLCLLQLGDVLLKRIELLLKHPENAPARNSAMVPDAQDFGKLGQSKSKSQGMAHCLHSLNAVRWIQAIA